MPISVPPYMPMAPRQRPNIDIAGSIGGLGDALIGGLEYGQKRKIDRATREVFANGIPTGPDGSPDYNAMAARLLQAGNIDAGLGMTRLAETQLQNEFLRGRPQYMSGPGGSIYTEPTVAGEEPREVVPGTPPKRERPIVINDTAYDPDTMEPIVTAPQEPKPATRRRGLNAAGQEIDQEWNGSEWVEVSGPKVPAPKSRSLSATAVNDLLEAGQNAQDINRLHETWNDSYGGYGVGGEVANTAGKRIPGSKYADQARWWQDYQTRKNDLRHSKFGASLTPGEKAEFAKADIDPNMDPEVIKANLDRQQKILTGAAKRLAKVWIKQGYDADAIAEAVGYSLEDLGIQAPAEEGTAVPGSTENAAPAEVSPDNPVSPEPQGEIIETQDGRFMMMPDGTVVQLD